MKKRLLCCCISSVVATAANAAEPTSQDVRYLDRVVISASQTEETLGDTHGSVSVISEEDIQRNLTNDVKGLFKYTPSVSVSGGAQGDGLINIRGITGNRVLISVDGVRQAKNLSWGSLNSSRNTVDVNTLKQVDVIPGPSSSIYGSDAMGGTVYFTTKDPSDLLTDPQDNFAGSIRSQYDDSKEGFSNTLSLAGRNETVEGLFIATREDAQEVRVHGDLGGTGPTREKSDPKDEEANSLFGKVLFSLPNDQTLTFTAEQVKTDEDTTQLSSSNADAFYNEDKKRTRLSGQYELFADHALFDSVTVDLDWQTTETDQYQGYFNARFGGDYRYTGEYDETTRNAEIKFKKQLVTDTIEHDLIYALDYEQTTFEQYRSSSLSGANRSMPRSESDAVAAYIQDQMTFGDSGLKVTTGLRYDRYKIDPQPDQAYLDSNPLDPSPENNEDSQLSFRLGATYDINDTTTLFGQFGQGFKAPDMDQMFANYGRSGAYKFIANPNLAPESSDSFEAGVRFNTAPANLEFLVFYNDYDNFIDEVTLPFDPQYPYGVYQQQNLAGVVIKGAEFKGALYLEELAQNLRGFELHTAIAYAEGTQKIDGVEKPLDSVAPLSGMIGLRYDAPNKRWGSELQLTAAKGKSRSDISSDNPFVPAGFGVVDLTAYYQVNDDLRLDAGIFNLTNKDYHTWDEARGKTADLDGLARFSEPERHFRIGVNWRF